MPLWGKTDSSISMPKYVFGKASPDFVLFEDNTAVNGGGPAGQADPSNRLGWYYKNAGAGQKINWYFFDGFMKTITLGQSSFFAVVTMYNVANKPFIGIYTIPQGAGDAAAWYRSRVAYTIPNTAVAGTKYLVHVGPVPATLLPELPRLELVSAPAVAQGPRAASEAILTAAFSSDSAASTNTVEFVCEKVGVVSPQFSITFDLRIRSQYNNPAHASSPKGDMASLYFVDTTEVELAKSKGMTGPGWWKYTTYTTSDGKVRHKAECLVPMKVTRTQAGDRDDQVVLPNGIISITAQPTNKSTTVGGSTTFSVTASASDASQLSYQWQQSTNGTTFTDIAGARLSSYLLTSATLGKNGYKYRVVVSAIGLESVTSNAATLTVA